MTIFEQLTRANVQLGYILNALKLDDKNASMPAWTRKEYEALAADQIAEVVRLKSAIAEAAQYGITE